MAAFPFTSDLQKHTLVTFTYLFILPGHEWFRAMYPSDSYFQDIWFKAIAEIFLFEEPPYYTSVKLQTQSLTTYMIGSSSRSKAA